MSFRILNFEPLLKVWKSFPYNQVGGWDLVKGRSGWHRVIVEGVFPIALFCACGCLYLIKVSGWDLKEKN